MKVISSTEKNRWAENAALKTDKASNLSVTQDVCQTIDGFGGCFNELGYIAMDKVTPEKKEEILSRLFSPEECGFTFCRLPMGASDYAKSWYSYDEVEDDYELKHFSIERDRRYLLPYLKDAMKYSGDLTLFASPWSPPTWMKFPQAYNFGTLRWEDEVLKTYARYFRKYVEAYEKEGIHIDQVHVQNEPISDQKFPSCVWTGKELKEFIRDYLGPEMKDMDTEVWLGTLNGPYEDYGMEEWQITHYSDYANEVLSDPEARKYVKGVGCQWGAKHALLQTHIAYPEVKLIQTENECGEGKNSWQYAEYVFQLMWTYFQNGVCAYTYWNMVLEEGGMSTWGWHQNSLVSVKKDGEVVYNPEYYLIRHFSSHVKKGAVRRGVKGAFAGTALAFENPDGTMVWEIHNPFDEARTLVLSDGKANYEITLEPHSFNTVIGN
ncbi:MAG: glycoside hydrolase family 30 protein [Eubacteriales bacterium]|nr:glycoside hydrolase family 30 protein [Eubacteriales bacterium]